MIWRTTDKSFQIKTNEEVSPDTSLFFVRVSGFERNLSLKRSVTLSNHNNLDISKKLQKTLDKDEKWCTMSSF